MFKKFLARTANPFRIRGFSTVAASAPKESVPFAERFSRPLQWLHWIGAGGITFCTVSAVIAGQIPNDPAKTSKERLQLRQNIMHYHESVGLLMLAAMVPRIGVRLVTKLPSPMESGIQLMLAKISHWFLYGAIVFMPVSGLAFGYLSGWGVPFFAWNVPGAPKEKAAEPTYKSLEGFFYENHHRVGQVLEYVLPIHIGAVGFHYAVKGQNLLRRMNPFR